MLEHLAASDGTCTGNFGQRKSCFVCSTLSIHFAMPRLSRDCGKSSSWSAEGWATPANSYSGWSKRASRGYCNHGWNEDATRGSPSAGRRNPRPGPTRRLKSRVSRAEVRVRPPRLKPLTEKVATDKEAAKRRLSELHRLLNSREGSLNATYRRNAEANDKAYDLNQKSVLALDALAKRVCGL